MPVDEDHVERTVRAFAEQRDENARLRDDVAKRDLTIAANTAEIETLKSELALALAKSDHYLRFSTEIVTRLSSIKMTIEEAERGARRNTYQPNKPLPNESEMLKQLEQQINSEPLQ